MVEVRLEPMSAEQFGQWREEAEAHYARSVAKTGVPVEAAAEEAAETFARLLPDGADSAGNHLWHAYDGDRRVGFLWLKVADKASGRSAFVHNLGVEESLRRNGYGRAIMVAGERWCRENGVTSIGLHVFAHNPGARSLYEQLGYSERGRNLAKVL